MFPNKSEALQYITDIRHFMFKENLTYEERKATLSTDLCSLAFDTLGCGEDTAQFIAELSSATFKHYEVDEIIWP